MAELYLFLAARVQMAREIIVPALSAGETVLADRYWLSTVAYQGSLSGVDEILGHGGLRALAQTGLDLARPTHWLMLDPPRDVAMARAKRKKDAIERRGEAYYGAVRARYRSETALLPPGSVHWLDAARPAEEVAEAAWQIVGV